MLEDLLFSITIAGRGEGGVHPKACDDEKTSQNGIENSNEFIVPKCPKRPTK
jgi:hypothetical protein